MGLLNKLFSKTYKLPSDIITDYDKVISIWTEYTKTVPKKTELINTLDANNLENEKITILKNLLQLELVQISKDEKEEKEIFEDLVRVSNSKQLKSLKILRDIVFHYGSLYEYVYELLYRLFYVLRKEIQITNLIISARTRRGKYIINLKNQLAIELQIIKQIDEIENPVEGDKRISQKKSFNAIFVNLINDVDLIFQIDKQKMNILQGISDKLDQMSKLGDMEGLSKSMIYQWGQRFYQEITDNIGNYELMASKGYSFDFADYAYAHSQEFIDIAARIINELERHETINARPVPMEFIMLFVTIMKQELMKSTKHKWFFLKPR